MVRWGSDAPHPCLSYPQARLDPSVPYDAAEAGWAAPPFCQPRRDDPGGLHAQRPARHPCAPSATKDGRARRGRMMSEGGRRPENPIDRFFRWVGWLLISLVIGFPIYALLTGIWALLAGDPMQVIHLRGLRSDTPGRPVAEAE